MGEEKIEKIRQLIITVVEKEDHSQTIKMDGHADFNASELLGLFMRIASSFMERPNSLSKPETKP
jgi:hypothetical protein